MRQLLLWAALLLTSICSAQGYDQDHRILLKSGARTLSANLQEFVNNGLASPSFAARQWCYLQFERMPTASQKAEISALGVALLEYIPNKTYIASLPLGFNRASLTNKGIRSVHEILPNDKINTKLLERPLPDYMVEGEYIRTEVTLHKNINLTEAVAHTQGQLASSIVVESTPGKRSLVVLILSDKIQDLAAIPCIQHIGLPPAPEKAESQLGASMHRAYQAHTLGFKGAGIKVGIYDDGPVGPHIDFTGRTNQTDVLGGTDGTHGDMVAGIAGGANNLDPTAIGMAPESFLYILRYGNSRTTRNSDVWWLSDSVSVFNASYSDGCNTGYTAITQEVDDDHYNNPILLNSYSAGNTGGTNCGYGAGIDWGTITGGHKIAKNGIASANLNSANTLESTSSKGPTEDGRLKPDLAALGQGHVSTDPNNAYAIGGGTSAASPGSAGVAAILYGAYRQFNAGALPPSSLIKAAMLNSAMDMGNPGPDYKFGFGRLDANRALDIIQNQTYLTANVSGGAQNNHTINVPAGTKQVKVMLYWPEPSATLGAARILINDLDLSVLDNNGGTVRPLILNPAPNAATLNAIAVEGRDSLNNVEQVVIDNPNGGNYTVRVNGFDIAQGPQEYYIVYTFIQDELKLTYPLGGESFAQGGIEAISWDVPTGTTGTFTIEYSNDNGTTWLPIISNVAADARQAFWTISRNAPNDTVLVRVRNGAYSSTSGPVNILRIPTTLRATGICPPNLVTVSWNAVAGASTYDIFLLGNKYMDSIGTTSATQFNIPVPAFGQDYWFSVRARTATGIVGRRANAVKISTTGVSNGCLLTCGAPDDAGIGNINSPAAFTRDCGVGSVPVEIVLQNIGSNPQSNFNVYYQIDNQPVISETVSATLPAGGTLNHIFGTPITGMPSGNYTFKAWTSLPNDLTPCNDTMRRAFTLNVSTPVLLPVSEEFSANAMPPNNWQLVNADSARTWAWRTAVNASGQTAGVAWVDCWAYTGSGQEDELITGQVDLANNPYPWLTFDIAHAMYNSNTEGLRVEISDDCGATWNVAYNKQGQQLATSTRGAALFIPNAAREWRTDSIDLSTYLGERINVKFVSVNDYGNNIYLDNVNVSNIVPNGVEDIANNKIDCFVFPNPTQSMLNIAFSQPLSKSSTFQVVNTLGQTVETGNINESERLFTLQTGAWPPGVYTIFFTDGIAKPQRVIVQK